MTDCLISFGANLGNPAGMLRRTLECFQSGDGLQVVALSDLFKSHPAGGPDNQPPYLNAVIRANTDRSAEETLSYLQRIEQQLGRQPAARWDARRIDLDLLLFGAVQVGTQQLTVPHPRLSFRRFLLEPAVQVAAGMKHPQLGCNLQQLLHHLDSTPPYIAVTGTKATAISRLVTRFCTASTHKKLEQFAASNPNQAAGLSLASEIEFLRARSEAVRQSLENTSASDYHLSPFWCEQTVAWAPTRWGVSGNKSIQETWKLLAKTTPRARLLVILETASETAKEERIRTALDDYIRTSSPGPLLRLRSEDDDDWHTRELRGAIEAMQATLGVVGSAADDWSP